MDTIIKADTITINNQFSRFISLFSLKKLKTSFFQLKKAQITLFALIGLAILLVIVLILYINGGVDLQSALQGSKTDQVTAFVEDCISQVSDEALNRLGQQGGYLDVDQFEIYRAQYDPFNSNVLSLGDGALFLPYWLYQRDNGQDRSEIPQLYKSYTDDNSIQDQLEQYITMNVNLCLNDFNEFKGQGMQITAQKELQTSVIIGETDVTIAVTYPLQVSASSAVVAEKNQKSYTLEKFSASKSVRLKKIYELGRDIVVHETESVFMEGSVRKLMAAYSRNDDSSFPPMYGGIEVKECSELDYWLVEDIKEDFKTMLQHNLPFMRIDNTATQPIVVTQADEADVEKRKVRQGVYDGLRTKISNKDYQGIETWFNFHPSYPFDLYLGSNGAVFPSRLKVDALLLNFCIFDYSFIYDITFPLVISLQDTQSSLNNKPYFFQFPVQVILKENYPRVRVLDLIAPDFEPSASECSGKYPTSGNTVSVTDAKTNKPVEKALIYFQCGPENLITYKEDGTYDKIVEFADRCFIGSTNEQGVFAGNLPQCGGGGMIVVEKKDYDEVTKLVGNVLNNGDVQAEVNLLPLKEFNLQIKKFFAAPPPVEGQSSSYQGIVVDNKNRILECNLHPEPAALQEYERAMVSINKLNTLGGSISASQVMEYQLGSKSSEPDLHKNSLKLAPGFYQAEIMLLRDERYDGEMTIIKNSQSIHIPGTAFSKGKTIYYPESDVEIPTTISGGSKFVFEIKPGDLDKNTIIFYVIDEGIPTVLEQVGTPSEHIAACTMLNSDVMRARII